MSLIKPNKLKAARALLGWSQSDLAEASGLASQTIKFYEQGVSVPSSDTLHKITEAFLAQDVYFTEVGVEQRDNTVRFIEGDNCILRLLDDIYSHLETSEQKHLWFLNADERISSSEIISTIRKIRSLKPEIRQLICEGDTYVMGDLKEYRYTPKQYFVNRPVIIYGERIALITKGKLSRVMIISDAQFSAMQTSIYEWLWSMAKPVKESTAHEKF